MIKTVIFDLGGVIVPFDFKRGYARMEPLCKYPAAEIRNRLWSTDLVTRFETGSIDARSFVHEICSVLELDTNHEEFCSIWTSIFLPDALIPENFLESLRSRYRLVLLSNTNSIHFEMVERHYPQLRHFDDYVLSYRVGAMKPSPKIYEVAVASANCNPDECFYTDDVLPYVEGARQFGINAVQFQSFPQLQEEMRTRGLA